MCEGARFSRGLRACKGFTQGGSGAVSLQVLGDASGTNVGDV